MSKFVLDFHEAIKRGKHYDLRVEIPNSNNWMSFSMNEFPPTEPGKRIYIVRSNDHSRNEALFTGEIKSGYGAGRITRKESGDCVIIKYSKTHIVIEFKGKKLKGIYHLINTAVFSKQRANYYRNVYAFFKGKILSEGLFTDEPERSIIKKARENFKFIYLYHGTRASDDIIKKEGLKLNKANKYGFVEEEIEGNFISFTSNKSYAKLYIQSKGFFHKQETSILICKLETKFLKFAYNRKNLDEYIYFKDIPPEDIIFQDQKEYKIIENIKKYLIQ